MSGLRLRLRLEPIAASRARHSKYSTYYKDPYNTYRRTCANALDIAMWGKERVTGPCIAFVHFIKERPAKPAKPYPLLGDGDNFEKALYDAMNKRCFVDDKHLVSSQWLKSWAVDGLPGETRIHLMPIDPVALAECWELEWQEEENECQTVT